jgi:hypothetical protein
LIIFCVCDAEEAEVLEDISYVSWQQHNQRRALMNPMLPMSLYLGFRRYQAMHDVASIPDFILPSAWPEHVAN